MATLPNNYTARRQYMGRPQSDYSMVAHCTSWRGNGNAVILVNSNHPAAPEDPAHLMTIQSFHENYRPNISDMFGVMERAARAVANQPNPAVMLPDPEATFLGPDNVWPPDCIGRKYEGFCNTKLMYSSLHVPDAQLTPSSTVTLADWRNCNKGNSVKACAIAKHCLELLQLLEAACIFHLLHPDDIIVIDDGVADSTPRLALLGGWLWARRFGTQFDAFEVECLTKEYSLPAWLLPYGAVAGPQLMRRCVGVMLQHLLSTPSPLQKGHIPRRTSKALPSMYTASYVNSRGDGCSAFGAKVGWPADVDERVPAALKAAVDCLLIGSMGVTEGAEVVAASGSCEASAVSEEKVGTSCGRDVAEAGEQQVAAPSSPEAVTEREQEAAAPSSCRAGLAAATHALSVEAEEEAGSEASGACTPRSSGSGASSTDTGCSSSYSSPCSMPGMSWDAQDGDYHAAVPCNSYELPSRLSLYEVVEEGATGARGPLGLDAVHGRQGQQPYAGEEAACMGSAQHVTGLQGAVAGRGVLQALMRAAACRLRRWRGPAAVLVACVAAAALGAGAAKARAGRVW